MHTGSCIASAARSGHRGAFSAARPSPPLQLPPPETSPITRLQNTRCTAEGGTEGRRRLCGRTPGAEHFNSVLEASFSRFPTAPLTPSLAGGVTGSSTRGWEGTAPLVPHARPPSPGAPAAFRRQSFSLARELAHTPVRACTRQESTWRNTFELIFLSVQRPCPTPGSQQASPSHVAASRQGWQAVSTGSPRSPSDGNVS